jgi:hypothetical protein
MCCSGSPPDGVPEQPRPHMVDGTQGSGGETRVPSLLTAQQHHGWLLSATLAVGCAPSAVAVPTPVTRTSAVNAAAMRRRVRDTISSRGVGGLAQT